MAYAKKTGMMKMSTNIRPGKAKLKYGNVAKAAMPKSVDPKLMPEQTKKKPVMKMKKVY